MYCKYISYSECMYVPRVCHNYHLVYQNVHIQETMKYVERDKDKMEEGSEETWADKYSRWIFFFFSSFQT